MNRSPTQFSRKTRGTTLWALLVWTGALGLGPSALHAQASRGSDPALSSETKTAIVEGIGQALVSTYIYEDVARDMATLLQEKLRAGAYGEIDDGVEFARLLTDDLRSVANDLHLGVQMRHVHPDQGAETETVEDGEADAHGSVDDRRRANFGIRKAEILEGNVGYLAIEGFEGGPEAGATVVAAMNLLGNSDALILDLRQNGGGGPSVIQMIFGYLLDDPTHILGFYTRETDTHQQFWSPPYVPGPNLSDVPVFVLVGPRTFSAAEAFSFSIQTLERGAVVGERTPGGSHPVRPVPISGTDFVVHVPFARTVDPRVESDWEGTGITPDIPASVEEALEVAHLKALATLRDGEADPDRRRALSMILDRRQARLTAPALGVEALAQYEGKYTGEVEVEILIREGQLIMNIQGRRFSSLTFLGDDQFALEGSIGQLTFQRDEGGLVSGFEARMGESGSPMFRRVGKGEADLVSWSPGGGDPIFGTQEVAMAGG
jgi:hypothetical protein